MKRIISKIMVVGLLFTATLSKTAHQLSTTNARYIVFRENVNEQVKQFLAHIKDSNYFQDFTRIIQDMISAAHLTGQEVQFYIQMIQKKYASNISEDLRNRQNMLIDQKTTLETYKTIIVRVVPALRIVNKTDAEKLQKLIPLLDGGIRILDAANTAVERALRVVQS